MREAVSYARLGRKRSAINLRLSECGAVAHEKSGFLENIVPIFKSITVKYSFFVNMIEKKEGGDEVFSKPLRTRREKWSSGMKVMMMMMMTRQLGSCGVINYKTDGRRAHPIHPFIILLSLRNKASLHTVGGRK